MNPLDSERELTVWLALAGGLLGAALAAVWWRSRATGVPHAVELDFADALDGAPEGVRVFDLGEGFVELVGEVGSEEVADAVERRVASTPGVHGVVNRIWIV